MPDQPGGRLPSRSHRIGHRIVFEKIMNEALARSDSHTQVSGAAVGDFACGYLAEYYGPRLAAEPEAWSATGDDEDYRRCRAIHPQAAEGARRSPALDHGR